MRTITGKIIETKHALWNALQNFVANKTSNFYNNLLKYSSICSFLLLYYQSGGRFKNSENVWKAVPQKVFCLTLSHSISVSLFFLKKETKPTICFMLKGKCECNLCDVYNKRKTFFTRKLLLEITIVISTHKNKDTWNL